MSTEAWLEAEADLAQVLAENKRLRDAILDIDAHAHAMGSDDDGFNSGGYIISIGSLHRALGVIGHTGARPRECSVAVELAHGGECEGCLNLRDIAFDAIASNRKQVAAERGEADGTEDAPPELIR